MTWRTMWERRDPMPDGLIDKVLVAIATENLDEEYELLHLVERSRELDGARGVVGDAFTIAFSGWCVLVAAASDRAHRRQVLPGRRLGDAAAQAMHVKVTQQSGTLQAVVDALGRFEIARLPTGLTRFFLFSDDAKDDTERSFATPTFEL